MGSETQGVLRLPSKHIHPTGAGVGPRPRPQPRGRFAKVRNQGTGTGTNIERSVKAFPRDNHRNNNTFGNYNRTHLATFPTRAIRGSRVLYLGSSSKSQGRKMGQRRVSKGCRPVRPASCSSHVCVTQRGMPPASNLHLRKQATGRSGLLRAGEVGMHTAAEWPEPGAAIPNLHLQPRMPCPPLTQRGSVHRNMGDSADLLLYPKPQFDKLKLESLASAASVWSAGRTGKSVTKWLPTSNVAPRRTHGTAQGRSSVAAAASPKHRRVQGPRPSSSLPPGSPLGLPPGAQPSCCGKDLF